MVESRTLLRSAERQIPARAQFVPNAPKVQSGRALWVELATVLLERQIVPRLLDAFSEALVRGRAQPQPMSAGRVRQNRGQGPAEGRRRRRCQRRGQHGR
jgi:hypothetical protein